MDAIVDKLTMQLDLTENENMPIVVERPIGNNRQARRFFLVGRLLTLKDFKIQFFMRTVKKLCDRNCVVKGSPWTFENALLILDETYGLEDPYRCSLRDSVINHRDFKPFGSWLRVEVKEWLDEFEMKPPRPLRPRWVTKAQSSNELGLADEVQRWEEDQDEEDKLRQGTIDENNGSIKANHHKRHKLCNETIQVDLNHELILGADSLAFNSPVTVEKGKNTIDNSGVFSPILWAVIVPIFWAQPILSSKKGFAS
ncbi:Hypothetical predicted protein [Prunus dulcis]|uniref:DUF4283 domain-containing protein n=1 Tax=Prunus dulcis TaxID=3755 RepID=A0A5E4EE22_PRUDU|nr:Hypothetical predicted protein [Prunus dulcis]